MNNTSNPLNTMTPQGDAAFDAVSALVSQVWNGLDQWLITDFSQDVGLYGLTGGQRVTDVLHDALLMITTQHLSPVRTLSNIANAVIDFAFTLSVQNVNKPLIQWLESVNLKSPYDNVQLGYPSGVEKYIKS
jgi:hypothetical protein